MKKLFLSFFFILLVSTSAFGEPEKQTYDNGYYIGEFNANNQRHGSGIYYWDSGTRYQGNWVNDKQHGYGIKYMLSGDKYAGDFLYGKRKGHGAYTWKNGDRFIGEEPEGFGRLYDFSKGTSKLVRFKNNKYSNASFSEANYHFETGKGRNVKAHQASSRSRLVVDKYLNKTSSTTRKWQLRYCKKTNEIIYSLNGYQCKAGETEVNKYQYENYLKQSDSNQLKKKYFYCKKPNGMAHSVYGVSCPTGERGISKTEYDRIISTIPINRWYVVDSKNGVNVRSRPTTNSAKISTIGDGVEVFVVSKVKDSPLWYFVRAYGKEGYVYKHLKPKNKTTQTKTTKNKKSLSSNPGVWVAIGIGIFIFFIFKMGGKKSASRYKSTPSKRASYVSKTSKPTSSTGSAKTYTQAKKNTPVGGKKTSRVNPMIIKKSKKTIKKGLICKYCDTENKYTAVTCISCSKSLS